MSTQEKFIENEQLLKQSLKIPYDKLLFTVFIAGAVIGISGIVWAPLVTKPFMLPVECAMIFVVVLSLGSAGLYGYYREARNEKYDNLMEKRGELATELILESVGGGKVIKKSQGNSDFKPNEYQKITIGEDGVAKDYYALVTESGEVTVYRDSSLTVA